MNHFIFSFLTLFITFISGLPDFVPDSNHLQQTFSIDYVDAESDPCLINEGCLTGRGMRKVLRFATMIHNRGTTDAVLGSPPRDPNNPANPRFWHWHYSAYANYELLASDKQSLVLKGHKNGFCLEDVQCENGKEAIKVHLPEPRNTGGMHGFIRRFTALIDITELDNHHNHTDSTVYYLRVTVNEDGFFPEVSTTNNRAYAQVVLENIPQRIVASTDQSWFMRGEGAAIPPPGGL